MLPTAAVAFGEDAVLVRPATGRTFSYGVVAVTAGIGALWPQATAAVLEPVLVAGLVSLGVAHGACDQLVLPAYRLSRSSQGSRTSRWGYLLRFGLGYLVLAGTMGLIWWRWPGFGVSLFFGLTVWHWGSADAPASRRPGVWVAHSLLRGALLLAGPAWWWPLETAHHVNGLLRLMGSAPVAASRWAALGPLVVAGHLLLWGYFAWQQQPARWHRDAREVLLLMGLLLALPPLLALGVYFVFWHSWQHVFRLTPVLGYMTPGPVTAVWGLLRQLVFFGQRALPMLMISLAAATLAYGLGGRAQSAGEAWLGLAVIGASVLTLPHALLVSLVMDSAKWRLGNTKATTERGSPNAANN